MGRTYEVFPCDDGWSFRLVDDEGNELETGGSFDGWKLASQAARDHRGDQREALYRMNDDGGFDEVGTLVGFRGPERIVLLRADGSLYGEIDHAIAEGGTPQLVSIAPASTQTEAVS